MAKNRYLKAIFLIKCKGRDAEKKEVLTKSVGVKVKIDQANGDEKNISLSVKCKYNTGGHGQRCKASHPYVDKVGEGIICPYSVDIPYAFDNR